MTARSLAGTLATALCAGALVSACGSSAATSSSTSPTAATSQATTTNPALGVALTAADLPAAAAGYQQVSDGLLGSTPNTDARVFASTDNTTRIEVDLAADTSPASATGDYAAYNTAAAKQVATQSGTSTPAIGSQANEYTVTDSNGHNVVSVAFVQGSIICVVTMVSSSGTVDAAVVESTATTQEQKISAAKL